jgi:hypothetical protein
MRERSGAGCRLGSLDLLLSFSIVFLLIVVGQNVSFSEDTCGAKRCAALRINEINAS